MTEPRRGLLRLAIETSGPVGSVAVALGVDVLSRTDLEGTTHARNVVPAIDEVLTDAGVERLELDGVIVGSGPGSFTGVRVAAATGKGLTHGLGISLWAVSSLEAAAAAHLAGEGGPSDAEPREEAAPEAPRYVLFDARGDRVYAGCFRVSEGGVETIEPPRAAHLTDILTSDLPDGVVFLGDGATRHRIHIESRGQTVLGPSAGQPTAEALIFVLGKDSGRVPLSNPGRWAPDYLRTSSAERARKA